MNTKILIIRLLLCSLVFNQINADCNAADAVKQLPNLTNSSFCSYAGFAPLDIKNESALFYWYVPNQLNLPNQPIIVWLQGELGLSSTWGLLTEGIGPIKVTPNPAGGYYVNYTDDGYDKSWSYNYNILFIDNPVGVGFSYFTPNKTNATQSVEENAINIWNATQYFMNLHTETQNLQWYFAGESLGAKTVTALAAQTILYNLEIEHHALLNAKIINLAGIIVGNGVFNGLTQMLSLINPANGASFVAPYQLDQLTTLAIHCENNAFNAKLKYGIKSCTNMGTYIKNVSGIDPNAISMTVNQTNSLFKQNQAYLNTPEVYQALNIHNSSKNGSLFQNINAEAAEAIEYQMLNSSLEYIDYLLTQIPCLIYDGAFDIEFGPAGTFTWLSQLNPPYNKILNQTKNIWYNSSNLPTGYYRSLFNLTYVTFDFAGTYVPYFQLNDSVQMLQNFFGGLPWTPANTFQNVSDIMINLLNNCSNNGTILDNGVCQCNPGVQLSDCSLVPDLLTIKVNVTLGPRGMAFYQLDLQGSDNILQIIGNSKDVLAYYSYSGSITDQSQAVAVLLPTLQILSVRSLYISAAPGSIVYLTVQNVNYDNTVPLLILTSQVLIVESFFASTFSAVIMIVLTLASAFGLYTAVAFLIRQRKRKVEAPMTTEIASQSSQALSQVHI